MNQELADADRFPNREESVMFQKKFRKTSHFFKKTSVRTENVKVVVPYLEPKIPMLPHRFHFKRLRPSSPKKIFFKESFLNHLMINDQTVLY